MTIEETFLPEADSWGTCQCRVCLQYVFDGNNLARQTLNRPKWVCLAFKLWMTYPPHMRGRTFYISGWGTGKIELIIHLPTDITRTFTSYQDVETYLHDPLNARTGQDVPDPPMPCSSPF